MVTGSGGTLSGCAGPQTSRRPGGFSTHACARETLAFIEKRVAVCRAYSTRDTWPVAESNAELAGRIIRNLGELLERLDPDVVWDNTRNVPPDHHGIQRGKAEVARIITEWVDSWADYRIAVDEVVDAGDDVVLVVTESGAGRQSGVPLEHHHCYIWSFRDGRIVWGTERGSKAEALDLIAERRSSP